ncbi:hypothetical protein [Desulfosporosinus sp. FKB]|uniref:hypothetical protein n=1 Tax=Desulfosporosinus sp. FKB TaxID=1969835 RepID=UPI000B4A0822|nr:hypothetical protein [Desulfosporosinus sp. FKB]
MDDFFKNIADCQLIKNALSTGCQYPAGFPRTMTGVLILRKILEETGFSSHSLTIFSKILNPLWPDTNFLGLKGIAICCILLK